MDLTAHEEATEALTSDREPMSDDELAGLLAEHARRCVGHYNSEIAGDQEESINFYYRRPMGDEREGRSKVVDGTVAAVVDNALAALLKPFVSAEETVSFQPRGPEDVETAEQATEYVNYVFHTDNNGFLILHDWFKDALLTKLGVVKIWWEDESEDRISEVNNLDDMQAEALMNDPTVEIVEGPYQDDIGLYSFKIRERYEDGCIKVENVPPEEYLISPEARPGRRPTYEGHRTRKMRSDLIEMGFDPEVVAGLAKYPNAFTDYREMARYQDETWNGGRLDNPGEDPSRDLIEIYDEYVMIDWNRDGVAELRRIVRSDTNILLNEEVEEAPFATLCPIPMPHKVYGLSLADQTRELQRISTVLWRQMLDNLYLSNNPDVQVTEAAERSDGSTVEALMRSEPGRYIPVGREPVEYSAIPFVADKSLLMLDRLNMEIEARTGVSKAGQGIDPDTLSTENKTATEVALVESGKNARIEMIARIFAETGVKQMFRKILKLLVTHQPRERIVRLRNKWVPMDPRDWDAEMDVAISVGLGVGTQQTQIASAQAILEVQKELAMSPFAQMVSPENVFNAVKKLLAATGTKDVDNFISEIDPNNPPPEKPDPEMMKAQADAQIQASKVELEQQKAAAQIQIQQQKNAADIEVMREKHAMDLQLQRDKAAAEAEMNMQRLAMERELAFHELDVKREIGLAGAKAKADAQSEIAANRPGGDLDK